MAGKQGGRALNDRQERFAVEYARSLNATQAYLDAGYKVSRSVAGTEGRKLLQKPAIQARIAASTQRGITAADLTVERVLREVGRIAFSDTRKFFNDDNELRHIRDLDDDAAAALSSVETLTTTQGSVANSTSDVSKRGESDKPDPDPEVQRMVRKLKVFDKVSALSLAMRYHGLLKDNVALTGAVNTAVTYRANMPKRGEEEA